MAAQRRSWTIPRGGGLQTVCILGLAAAGVTLGLLSFIQSPALVWNSTPSVPVGLYRLTAATPQPGDIIALRPDGRVREAILASGALVGDQLLLKPLAAHEGDTVCGNGASVTINGRAVAAVPSKKRRLPVWQGCRRLAAGEIFLISPHPFSFDSRYLGPVSASQVAGVAHPLATFPGKTAP